MKTRNSKNYCSQKAKISTAIPFHKNYIFSPNILASLFTIWIAIVVMVCADLQTWPRHYWRNIPLTFPHFIGILPPYLFLMRIRDCPCLVFDSRCSRSKCGTGRWRCFVLRTSLKKMLCNTLITVRNSSCGKVFTRIYHSVHRGEVYNPLGRHPCRTDTSCRTDTPPPGMATAADSTHSTGIHSC